MTILDTDHVSVLKYPGTERCDRLRGRLRAAGERPTTSIVTAEEQMRGWLASLAKERLVRRQVRAYRELAELFDFLGGFGIVLFDDLAAERFDGLSGVRLRASDKKIAAIVLANDALLLTANRQDFERVPGLRFENWMDG
ncbi:MAG: type II toxin-antitoxin system VapC family toxin [Gemmataceae bacterium]|nr:type II toxin-antitoxin system VapC family toxin [Gemmataceae bacterium]